MKALSEGSDCRCKCVVRPLSRSACRRIEEGSASTQDFYTVETITSGPECKCACIAPPSAVNPCEGEFRLKKLREAGKENVKVKFHPVHFSCTPEPRVHTSHYTPEPIGCSLPRLLISREAWITGSMDITSYQIQSRIAPHFIHYQRLRVWMGLFYTWYVLGKPLFLTEST